MKLPKNVRFLNVDNRYKTSLVAQMVKNLPAMWEIQVQSLGWEDPLGSQELDMTERLTLGTKEV